jgi:hypothetical protein
MEDVKNKEYICPKCNIVLADPCYPKQGRQSKFPHCDQGHRLGVVRPLTYNIVFGIALALVMLVGAVTPLFVFVILEMGRTPLLSLGKVLANIIADAAKPSYVSTLLLPVFVLPSILLLFMLGFVSKKAILDGGKYRNMPDPARRLGKSLIQLGVAFIVTVVSFVLAVCVIFL